MVSTRRELIKNFLGGTIGANSITQLRRTIFAETKSYIDNTEGGQKQRIDRRHTTMKRNAYVTLPGLAFTTLFIHLSTLLNQSNPPLILIDIYDLERLRGQAVRERDNREVQIRKSITETLIQRGIIQEIDYTRHYSIASQKRNLHRYQTKLKNLPDHRNRESTQIALDNVSKFTRGDYQRSLRSALGSWGINLEKRQELSTYHRKMSKGVEDPRQFNKDAFGQYIAALEVRASLDRHSDSNIVGVLGQGEEEGISKIIQASKFDIDEDKLRVSSNSNTIHQIVRPSRKRANIIHEKLSKITTIAKETTGIQNEDWYLLGGRLAAPLFPNLLTGTHGLNGQRWNPNSIVAETQEVLGYLEKESKDNRPEHIQYQAERLIEETEEVTTSLTDTVNQLERAADLSNYSRDLRELAESDRFSPTALFTAATVKMDPHHRYNEDGIYHRAVKLQRRLQPVSIPDPEILGFRKRGNFRRGGEGNGWYQVLNRERTNYSNNL